ncbi:hypothetical protein EJB05_18994 [Eragrostis curvula]|uniref:Coenzyme Q-binding protein COQ10 START domain-containing protein n=1 Tax=Eragrostis curvula TaxID=38414 RepID=A0A5J9VLB6_9POAL|nr:hypothetical protein EJB05_18994 [Eragrostis curvula]
MAASAAGCRCCFSSSSSSHGGFSRRSLRLLTANTSSFRVVFPSAPSPRRRLLFSSAADQPLDLAAAADEQDDDWSASEEDERYGFQIQASKIGKLNRRLVRARVRVEAPLEAVWGTLTDYEGLADFIPGLSECRLLQQDHRFARLYQVGEQDLALGFKFNAKGTIDCFEGELEMLPAAGARRREIAFKMIDGDFKVFEGKWSVEEVDTSSIIDAGRGEISEDHEFQTTLSYIVELEPKLWVPVRLLEGRICSEIKNNLVSIREQAQRTYRLEHEVIPATDRVGFISHYEYRTSVKRKLSDLHS